MLDYRLKSEAFSSHAADTLSDIWSTRLFSHVWLMVLASRTQILSQENVTNAHHLFCVGLMAPSSGEGLWQQSAL